MKFKIEVFIPVLLASMIQGCSSVIPIKTQTSTIKDVAKCIVDGDSHGQCTQNSSFVNPYISSSNISYFDVLNVMELLDAIGDENLLSFSGNQSAFNKFVSYKNKYSNLNCADSYNLEVVNITKDALNSTSNKNIHVLFDKQLLGGNIKTGNTPTIQFDTQNFNDFIEDIAEADSYGGFNALQCAALQNMSFAKSEEEADALGVLVEELSYTKAYFKAYFRHGKFIQGEIEVSTLEPLAKLLILQACIC